VHLANVPYFDTVAAKSPWSSVRKIWMEREHSHIVAAMDQPTR